MEKLKKKVVCLSSVIFGAQLAIGEKPSMPKCETNGSFLL